MNVFEKMVTSLSGRMAGGTLISGGNAISKYYIVYTDPSKVVVNVNNDIKLFSVQEINDLRGSNDELFVRICDNLNAIKTKGYAGLMNPTAFLPNGSYAAIVNIDGFHYQMNVISLDDLKGRFHPDELCEEVLTDSAIQKIKQEDGSFIVYEKDIIGAVLELRDSSSILERDEVINVYKEKSPAQITAMMLGATNSNSDRKIMLAPKVDETVFNKNGKKSPGLISMKINGVDTREIKNKIKNKLQCMYKFDMHLHKEIPMAIIPAWFRVPNNLKLSKEFSGNYTSENGFIDIGFGNGVTLEVDVPKSNRRTGFCVCTRTHVINDDLKKQDSHGINKMQNSNIDDLESYEIKNRKSVSPEGLVICEGGEYSYLFYSFKNIQDIYLCSNFLPLIMATDDDLKQMMSNFVGNIVDLLKYYHDRNGFLTQNIISLYTDLLKGIGFTYLTVDKDTGSVVALDNDGNQVLIKAAIYNLAKEVPKGPIRYGMHYATFIPYPGTHIGLMVYGLKSTNGFNTGLLELSNSNNFVPDKEIEFSVANNLLYYVLRGDYVGYLMLRDYLQENYAGYTRLTDTILSEEGIDDESIEDIKNESDEFNNSEDSGENNQGEVQQLDPNPIL